MSDEDDIQGGQEVPRGDAISGHHGRGRYDNIVQGLILAGITALVGLVWKVSDTCTRLETSFLAEVQQRDRDILRINTTLERHDQRLTDLERGNSPRQPNPYDRQKRQ